MQMTFPWAGQGVFLSGRPGTSAGITCPYSLFRHGIFDMEKDVLETNPLNNEDLSENEKRIKTKLSSELELIPQLPKK